MKYIFIHRQVFFIKDFHFAAQAALLIKLMKNIEKCLNYGHFHTSIE